MYGGKYFYDTSLSVLDKDILQNVSQPCPGSQEGQPHPGGVSSRWARIVLLCSALGQPHLKCWGSFEHHHTRDIKLFRGCPEEAEGLVRGLERSFTRSSWGHLVCSAWRRGHWGQTSPGSSSSSWGAAEGWVQSSSLLWPVTGHEKTAEGESGEVQVGYQEGFFTQRVVWHWTRSPGTGSQPQSCLRWRSVRHKMGLLGYPLQGQELDTVILRAPFQLSILCDSVQHGKGGLLLT